MLEYYKTKNPSLISSDLIRDDTKWDRRGGVLNIYGEPGVYPQFVEKIVRSEMRYDVHTKIFVIPENGEINEDTRVFFTRIGGTYTGGNTCEEQVRRDAVE